MKDGKGTFNVLASVEKHILSLKPLLPRQAIICMGEYPIKTITRGAIQKDGPLPIFIEKSSEEIDQWTPKGFSAHHVLGFETKNRQPLLLQRITPYRRQTNQFWRV